MLLWRKSIVGNRGHERGSWSEPPFSLTTLDERLPRTCLILLCGWMDLVAAHDSSYTVRERRDDQSKPEEDVVPNSRTVSILSQV